MLRRLQIGLVAVLAMGGAIVAARAQEHEPSIHGLLVPGGAATLSNALGLPGIHEDHRVVLDLVRWLHGRGRRAARSALQRVERLEAGVAAPGHAPFFLKPAEWDTILGRRVPANRLLGAILLEFDAALLYHGLAALDPSTREALSRDTGLLRDIHARHAGVFATLTRGVRIREGRIETPGGAGAVALWETLVGRRVTEPGSFVRGLLAGDEGRLAYFYDTLAHLDAPRLRYVLGPDLETTGRAESFERLYGVFKRIERRWKPNQRPFDRPPADPAWILMHASVTPSGELEGPSWRGLWETVFRSPDLPDPADRAVALLDADPVDAASLLARLCAPDADERRDRFEAFRFAQRVFGTPDRDAARDVFTAIRGFARYRALLLTLERVGVRDAAIYAAAARHARQLSDIGDNRVAAIALRQFQASVALVERARFARTLDVATAAAALQSLMALPLSRDGRYEGRLARWVEQVLVPSLASALGDAEQARPLDRVIVEALAGRPCDVRPDAAGCAQGIHWEDFTYRLDVRQERLTRFARIRARQRSPAGSLDAALDAFRPAPSEPAEARLADVLTVLAYLPHLGDPGGTAAIAGDVALRHDLGLDGYPREQRIRHPWTWPSIVSRKGVAWHVRGSLLGLEVGLASLTLRRAPGHVPSGEPVLNDADADSLARTVALANAADFLDADRDAIVEALRRGRLRAAAVSAAPSTVDDVAAGAGLSEWRREALRGLAARAAPDLDTFFSLGELMRLGRGRETGPAAIESWGMSASALDGCLCRRFPAARPWEAYAGRSGVGERAAMLPDLNLRIAEMTSELKLPAALAPYILAYATRRFIDASQAAEIDDWWTLVHQARSTPQQDVEEYVTFLTADGPLYPVPSPAPAR